MIDMANIVKAAQAFLSERGLEHVGRKSKRYDGGTLYCFRGSARHKAGKQVSRYAVAAVDDGSDRLEFRLCTRPEVEAIEAYIGKSERHSRRRSKEVHYAP